MKKPLRWLAALTVLLLPLSALAQQQGLTIDIVGGSASATPIAVIPMPYQAPTLHRRPMCLRWSARP